MDMRMVAQEVIKSILEGIRIIKNETKEAEKHVLIEENINKNYLNWYYLNW